MGDSSIEVNAASEIDERAKLYLELGDSDIVVDLRQQNSGHPPMYQEFWDECIK